MQDLGGKQISTNGSSLKPLRGASGAILGAHTGNSPVGAGIGSVTIAGFDFWVLQGHSLKFVKVDLLLCGRCLKSEDQMPETLHQFC